MLHQNAVTINFADDTYAEITGDAISIHEGQRNGDEKDWGGRCIAHIELDKALSIAEAILRARQASDEEDAWIERLAAEHDEREALRHMMYGD